MILTHGINSIKRSPKTVFYLNDFSGLDSAKVYGGPATYSGLTLDSTGVLFSTASSSFNQRGLSFQNKSKFKLKVSIKFHSTFTSNGGQYCGDWRWVSFNPVTYYSNRRNMMFQIFNVRNFVSKKTGLFADSQQGAPYYTCFAIDTNVYDIYDWYSFEMEVDVSTRKCKILQNGTVICEWEIADLSKIGGNFIFTDKPYDNQNGVIHYVKDVMFEAF